MAHHTSFLSISICALLAGLVGCNASPDESTATGGSGGATTTTASGGSGGDAGKGGATTTTTTTTTSSGGGGSGGAACTDSATTVRYRVVLPDGYDLAGGAVRLCGEYLVSGQAPVNHWDCLGNKPDIDDICSTTAVCADGGYECTAETDPANKVTFDAYISGEYAAYAFDRCDYVGGGNGENFAEVSVTYGCKPIELAYVDNFPDDNIHCLFDGVFTTPGEQ